MQINIDRNGGIQKTVVLEAELDIPHVCTIDDEGAILLADKNNNRLLVRDKAEKWHTIDVQPPLKRPHSAVLHNGKLYVMSRIVNSLSMYTPIKQQWV